MGIDKIIRVGGQSKLKELEGKNLRAVAQEMAKTRQESSKISSHFSSLKEIQEKADMLCMELSRRPDSWAAVKDILRTEFPRLYMQFDIQDDDGFEQVGGPDKAWDRWRGGFTKKFRNFRMNKEVEDANWLDAISNCEDIESMPKSARFRFVRYLSKRIAALPAVRLAALAEGQAIEMSGLQAQQQDVDRRCLNQADVIGITTTGLAKQVKLLSRVNAKVIICEEAGEVLEGHLINALLPTCQHLIQIGDHEQLRPQINTYDLSLESNRGKSFRLDESMFERLVREKTLSPAQLNIQRRMRPGISTLVRNTLYEDLEDHPSTSEYPDVVGMRQNIFWLNHTYPEAGANDSQTKSHSNAWEVKMVHGLVRHLVRQGHYNSKDIAVLTPYTGQLQKLRRELGSSFEVVLSDRDEEALARDNLETAEAELEVSPNWATVKRASLVEVLRIATV